MEQINGMILHDKPVSEATLKKLLLIFDRIYFLDPIENDYFIPGEVAKYKNGRDMIINAPLLPL
ncbi:hypothetical protein GCM10007049_06970 [Echinicola pacifica]|uniref:Uncharacterized protein n=1 Tax=Echinicola pacifica TaxID=346377 RepID=A0A918PQ19_9BACT|nr:hypothetical protein [Echinicola pacifica]GGZ17177.1 hypothetical protein GCM10007049_06970 [Echinicola pacifica]